MNAVTGRQASIESGMDGQRRSDAIGTTPESVALWAIAVLLLIIGAILCAPASAQTLPTAGETLFILDASGSMWGRIDGKPKIGIAKQVMATLVSELPDDARVGLIAYGHRRKGDCNDVETLVAPSRGDKTAVLTALHGMNARGKTPLAHSVEQAIGLLRSEEGNATVVLVSDGIESCGGDPCAVVEAARAAGVRFVMHTVGFGLGAAQSAQLRCMAKAGGGEYFAANNAQQLLESTRKAMRSDGRGRLQLTLRANGQPVAAWVKISPSDGGAPVVLSSDEGVKPGSVFALAPGHYRIELLPAGLRGGVPMVLDEVVVIEGKTVERTVDFDQVTLRVTATDNGRPVVVAVRVAGIDDDQTVFDTDSYSTLTMHGVKTPYAIQLAPGKYRLTVTIPDSSIMPHRQVVDLSTPGQRLEAAVVFHSGTLRIAVEVDGRPIKAGIRVTQPGAEGSVFETLPYIGVATPLTLKLAAGRYDLHIYPMGVEGLGERQVADVEVRPDAVSDSLTSYSANANANAGAGTAGRAAADGMERDTDRPGGGDFRHLSPPQDDPALCRDACRDDAHCRSWTYVKPNTIQGPGANCWLKTGVPPAVANDCCISGIKGAPENQ